MTPGNTDLFQQISSLESEQFTGKLEISSISQEKWQLFFYQGKLAGADGGSHPNRSWRRLYNKHISNINLTEVKVNYLEQFAAFNYQILKILLDRQLITKQSAKAIIIDRIDEVIFEIIEQEFTETLSYSSQTISEIGISLFKISPVLISPQAAATATRQKWTLWMQKGLGSYSPNLAPIIVEPEQLRQEVSEVVYQNFIALLDGNNTLYDLACQMKSDIIRISCSLIPYIDRGSLELTEVGDIAPPITIVQIQSQPATEQPENLPLVACIDDSLQIGLVMEQIVLKAGYRFASIQQPLQAIPRLIANPPDLIFLDVRMPIINGYELCSQIRRISQLQEVPIVMLTGQDGIVDRMRAKVVGAYDFMSKPIDDQKIAKILDKFLCDRVVRPKTRENSNVNSI